MIGVISANVNKKFRENSSVCKSINIFRFVLTNNLSYAICDVANFHTTVAPSGVRCEVDLGVAAWMSAGNSVGLSGRRCQFHSFY